MDGWTGGRDGWFKGEPPHILNRSRHIHSLYISLEIRFGRTLSFSLRVDLFIVHKFINNQIPGAFYLDCDRNNHNHPPPSTYSWIKALFGLSHVGPIWYIQPMIARRVQIRPSLRQQTVPTNCQAMEFFLWFKPCGSSSKKQIVLFLSRPSDLSSSSPQFTLGSVRCVALRVPTTIHIFNAMLLH